MSVFERINTCFSSCPEVIFILDSFFFQQSNCIRGTRRFNHPGFQWCVEYLQLFLSR